MTGTLAIAVVGLLVAASSACGQVNDSWVDLGPDAGMVTCPGGDGPVYEYITVHVLDNIGIPIPGVPHGAFFFTVTGGDVTISPVDPETDSNGRIRFSMVGNETIILLAPEFLTIECQIYTVILDDIDYLEVNSFDIAPSGCVDLPDFGMFSSAYLTAAPWADFDWDGTVGLVDFALFSAHYLNGDCGRPGETGRAR